MHLPNCHPRHRALRLDEPRYSRAISGRSLVQASSARKSFVIEGSRSTAQVCRETCARCYLGKCLFARLFPLVSTLKEVRCSFYEFSKPIRFCSNLVETFFNPFPIRKCKKIGGHHVGFQDGADQSSLDYTCIFAQVFSINSAGWKAMNF